MFFGGNNFYYITLGLQAICVIHCIRSGSQQKWIWIIVFLPIVGCIAYIFTEIRPHRGIRTPQVNIGAVFNPGGKIKKLEDELKFTNTFANRVRLADAYLAAGYTEKAIELYEGSLTGAFSENEQVLGQLVVAYFTMERYDDTIAAAKKIYKTQQFIRSRAHMLYAKALENVGQTQLAENEFKLMKGRYSYFEQRYEYGQFLIRSDRNDDARQIFTEILDEAPHLGPVEKRGASAWIAKSKEALRGV